MSTFAKIRNVDERIADLQRDLESGAWRKRHRRLLNADSLDLGYRLVIACLT